MNAQPNTSLRQITSLMNKAEKIINWYNRKYNFNMEAAKPKEQKEYNMMLNLWDTLKVKRDGMKVAA